MIVPAIIDRSYNNIINHISQLKEKVSPILLKYCELNNFAYSQRIKTVESLTEKIESGRFKDFNEIDDLWASSIIVPTLNHESAVISFIESTFKIKEKKLRGYVKKAPEVFRFDSTRIICEYESIPGQKSIFSGLYFEIQIKSAFEHAWTVTSHSISYKSENVDWGLFRLVSQMKAAVEQLDVMAIAYKDIYSMIPKSNWPELKAKELIMDLLSSLRIKLPIEIIPKDLSRFSENFIALIRNKDNNKYRLEKNTNDAIEVINRYFNSISQSDVPRSLSLFQFLSCILIEEGYFPSLIFDKSMLITDEMISLFPKTNNIENKFII